MSDRKIFRIECGVPPAGTNTLRKWLAWRQDEDVRMMFEAIRQTLYRAELARIEPDDDTVSH